MVVGESGGLQKNQMRNYQKNQQYIQIVVLPQMSVPQTHYVDESHHNHLPSHIYQFQSALGGKKYRRKKYISKNLRKDKKTATKIRTKPSSKHHSFGSTDGQLKSNRWERMMAKTKTIQMDNPEANEKLKGEVFELESIDEEKTDVVEEYCGQIQISIHQKESKYVPSPLQHPTEHLIYNRTQLIRWLFVVSSKLKFNPDTAFLSVNILDRILGLKSIEGQYLHLLAISCMYVAAKYEEILIPKLEEFVFLGKGNPHIYKRNILHFQSMILTLLDFDLSYVSPVHFINKNFPESQKSSIIQNCKLLMQELQYRTLKSSQVVSEVLSRKST